MEKVSRHAFDFSLAYHKKYTMSGYDEQFQRTLMQEQQRAMIMEAVRKITNVAFDKCVQKPESSLTSRQATCIAQTAAAYLESSAFLSNRMSNRN